MIITEKFVFLHLPKTGGTFVTEILKKIDKLYPCLRVKYLDRFKHKGIKNIPSVAKGLPIVTSVRPPHEHYISRYEFKWWCRSGKNEYRPSLVEDRYPAWPNLSFSDFLKYRNDWDTIPLSRFKDPCLREEIRCILKKKKIGFNSFEFIDLISSNSIDIFKDIDNLNKSKISSIKSQFTFLFQPRLSDDLYNLLLNFNVPDDVASIAKNSQRIKPKFKDANLNLKDKSSYYNKADLQYVRKLDRFIFKMFNDLLD